MKAAGIALTNNQAKELKVHVGDKVIVHDNQTNKDVVAVFYDSAGNNKKDDMHHMEMNPALADQLGVDYKDKHGGVHDSVNNSEKMTRRFFIRPNK